ncbi:muramidase family protein [Halothermothrix orenii]|uniref:Peptidoglycan-binding LysM n=1 Tax=Halothermothrix orenii (strain H 168 / OCM 544 / DSM 9562) TaxID=373903 RepID=B8D0L2_HALOH|nr:LysM peptidoglycan-binding domain-containing protein [Halothermothrix orenii]ACL70948.1 Peptidoglycan-binding LysM [Halothermothrix orenii H 168]
MTKKIIVLSLLLLFLVSLIPLHTAGAAVIYQVKSGDTIWEISREFNVPVEIIIQQNNISNPASIYTGQKLLITSENDKIIITIGDNQTGQNQNTHKYTVKPGDTLWKLAQKFNTSITELVDLNNLEQYSIYIGQKLQIPSSNAPENDNNFIYYTIQPGDILWNIAQKYDTTVEQLIELNNIKDAYDLYPGRKLLVPLSGGNTPAGQETSNPSSVPYTAYYFYKIQEGDKIWKIADTFGVRVSELVGYNNIENINQIQTGQILIIPLEKSTKLSYVQKAAAKLKNYYRVKNNETLVDIAKYFMVPEEGLRAINHLQEDETVYPGQLLLMPVSKALFNKHELYKVKSGGEYIFDIAYHKGVSIKSILKVNYLKNPNQKFDEEKVIIIPLDEESKVTWIDYENGKPQNSWLN